jgi:hypothetical protein
MYEDTGIAGVIIEGADEDEVAGIIIHQADGDELAAKPLQDWVDAS